ncbi:hypothetical protein SOP85_03240 [Pseudomonas sp. YuFO20]|uniref:hypothetical protein n=1 Tax=Pseudomonas sp. YuFO20 TaxID=3095362 RepID=UPI002B24C138|nr:hypothetical protein [Pseudomonas sp. YuFO20]MEB2514454.1 hypothetical protein [Pseudomonas sp. YuFO20]
MPIYAAIFAFSGASGGALMRGTLGAALMMLFLGRPYGRFLIGYGGCLACLRAGIGPCR